MGAVNGLFSSLAVVELLLRLHPSRLDPNGDFAVQTLSLTAGFWQFAPEEGTDDALGLRLPRQIEMRMHRGHHDVQLRQA